MITIIFLLGYIAASFLDIQKVGQWINTQVLAYHEVKPEAKPQQRQAANPPKPKFEFYTLLANEKVPNSQRSAQTTQSASTSNVTVVNNQGIPAGSDKSVVVTAKPTNSKVEQKT